MTTPTVALLRQTLARIEADPASWMQATWAIDRQAINPTDCGTAYCFGGHAVVLHGNTLDIGNGGNVVRPLPGDDLDPDDTWRDEGGQVLIETWDYARTILGLTREEADYLFASGNELDDLRLIVDAICAEAGS